MLEKERPIKNIGYMCDECMSFTKELINGVCPRCYRQKIEEGR